MNSKLKEELKNAPFVIDWDVGERYYQVHVFETADGTDFIQISSKTNKEGKIEMFSRGRKELLPFTAKVAKPFTKQKFEEAIELLKKILEKAGFVHRFIDLSQCNDPAEAMQLLAKTDSRFEFKIRPNE